jgi:hypothetical protein
MARIRTIKPEFWRHEELSALPEATHMLAAALLNYCDDEGYFNANEKLVQAECSPLREPSVSTHDSLTALANIGYVALGTAPDGKRYGRVLNFGEHQRINRKTPSKIKNIEVVWEPSVSPHTQLSESSHPEGKGREQGREGKGMEVRADARDAEFGFLGAVVRLKVKDFAQWQSAYSNLDLKAELVARDAWLAGEATDEDRRKWFITTSKYLANRNAEAKVRGGGLSAIERTCPPEIYRGVL